MNPRRSEAALVELSDACSLELEKKARGPKMTGTRSAKLTTPLGQSTLDDLPVSHARGAFTGGCREGAAACTCDSSSTSDYRWQGGLPAQAAVTGGSGDAFPGCPLQRSRRSDCEKSETGRLVDSPPGRRSQDGRPAARLRRCQGGRHRLGTDL